MNILCIGYFDKHSRFFLDIKKELRSEFKNLNFRIMSICFSGMFYNLIRVKFSCWLPAKSWMRVLTHKKKYLNTINSSTTYKGINYKNLIQYHLKLNPRNSEIYLCLQALAYLDIFEIYLSKHKPDLLIMLGDSRLSIESCIAMANKKKIKISYLEQGPFNTTLFNETGANANAIVNNAFNNISNEHIETEVKKSINTSSRKKYNRSFIYRGCDYFLSFFQNTTLYPPDLKYSDTFPTFLKKQKATPIEIHHKGTIILLILQVPMDVNMIYHSPHFKNHYDIVKSVHNNLPERTKLIIREHPVYKGKYEKELYQYAKNNNLLFDNTTPLKKALNNARLVVVNNSTVGIEAIALNKNVVTLGNSYYNNPKICVNFNGSESLKIVLNKGLNFSLDPNNVSLFLYKLIETNLVETTITDDHLVASKTIAKKITQRLQKL